MKSNKLNLFSLTMIVIGLVIGLGIFRTSSDAAKAALTPNVFFFAWVAGGLIALCGALTYAEIGSRLPVTGGKTRKVRLPLKFKLSQMSRLFNHNTCLFLLTKLFSDTFVLVRWIK